MNQLFKLFLAFLMCLFSQNLFAQTQKICNPFNIPLAGIPCGEGYTGTKFPMRTKVCPSGQVTDGLTFNTDNCKPANSPITDPNATDCKVTPTAVGCMSAPTLRGCDSGRHWVLTGSNIAHCVADDMDCGWGKTLKHDNLGNPYCEQNTCAAPLVLQGDGISCACAVGLIFNGSACVAPCSPSSSTQYQSCGAGYTGNQSRIATATCPSGVMSYSSWDTSGCVAVACPASTSTTGACPAGFTGQTVTTTNYVGVSCTAISSTNSSGCTPLPPSCTSSTSTETAACPPGLVGTMSRVITNNSCTGIVHSDWDQTSCVTITQPPSVCPNGATNWPTCTFPKPKFFCDAVNADPSKGDLIADISTPYPYDPQNFNYIVPNNTNAQAIWVSNTICGYPGMGWVKLEGDTVVFCQSGCGGGS